MTEKVLTEEDIAVLHKAVDVLAKVGFMAGVNTYRKLDMFVAVAEKGFPMPSENQYRKRRQWPFPEMEVGDSFRIPPGKHASVSSCAAFFQKKNKPMKFCVRKTPAGSRCWRIE